MARTASGIVAEAHALVRHTESIATQVDSPFSSWSACTAYTPGSRRTLEIETAEGEALSIQARDGAMMVEGATVVQAGVEADDGVIRVIDTVVLPQS